MSIKHVITPELVEASVVFSEKYNRVGLYIPMYQRKYSWGGVEFARLFNDITDAINREPSNSTGVDRYFHFFGSTIFYEDNQQYYVCPRKDNKFPKEVLNIVDGQQRMTTLSLISTLLLNHLNSKSELFESSSFDTNLMNLLKEKYGDLKKKLLHYYSLSKSPKIIRSLDDTWVETNNGERYRSPVAFYLWQFANEGGGGIK